MPGELLTQPGQRAQTWRANCVAIGLGNGFLQRLESASIQLIQRGITRLLQMLPAQGICPADIAEYKQLSRIEIEHLRDFIILRHHVTQRQDSAFWRHCREMDIPPLRQAAASDESSDPVASSAKLLSVLALLAAALLPWLFWLKRRAQQMVTSGQASV